MASSRQGVLWYCPLRGGRHSRACEDVHVCSVKRLTDPAAARTYCWQQFNREWSTRIVIAEPPAATVVSRNVAYTPIASTPTERSLTRDRVVASLQLVLALRRQARLNEDQ